MTTPLSKLFRWKPVAAWGAVGILIATSCAVHSGLTVDWLNLLIATGIVLLIQGIVAHGINDLADEAVDRIAPIEATGRSKLLVSGEMTRCRMAAVISSAATLSFLLLILLMVRVDYGVLVFAGVAVYAAFGYSLKPLQLGWRPFSELTVVVPVITAMICGVEYVLIGTVTLTAIYIGISYGFFNASWFMYSRAQDYEADKAMRKTTTIVRYGLDSTPEFAVTYLFISGLFALFAAVMTGWITGLLIMAAYIGPALDYVSDMRDEEDCLRPRPIAAGKRMHCTSPGMVSDSPPHWSPEVCAKMRVRGMRFAAIYGVLASIGIFIGGIII
jgi:1,4-dihydroxy-2-naphthoate octaprenyltransferase